jgi:hypothetical protein
MKEEIIKTTDRTELWCLFHTFLRRLNERRLPTEQIVVLDSDLENLLIEMKKDYS